MLAQTILCRGWNSVLLSRALFATYSCPPFTLTIHPPQEGAQLLTRALREAAEQAQAEAYGPIPVRIHFPDNIIVQAAFSALDTLLMLKVRRISPAIIPPVDPQYFL